MSITDRLSLPLLTAGQAQKEVTHNEALALVDVLTQAVVEAVGPAAIPASPSAGQCWIVGVGATGAWAGNDGAIACRTAGGWRFVAPTDGLSVWSRSDSTYVQRVNGAWMVGVANVKHLTVNQISVVGPQQPAIVSPTAGAVIDAESRAAITAILFALRAHGLIAT